MYQLRLGNSLRSRPINIGTARHNMRPIRMFGDHRPSKGTEESTSDGGQSTTADDTQTTIGNVKESLVGIQLAVPKLQLVTRHINEQLLDIYKTLPNTRAMSTAGDCLLEAHKALPKIGEIKRRIDELESHLYKKWEEDPSAMDGERLGPERRVKQLRERQRSFDLIEGFPKTIGEIDELRRPTLERIFDERGEDHRGEDTITLKMKLKFLCGLKPAESWELKR